MLILWNLFWRLTNAVIAVAVLHLFAAFSVRQAIGIVATAWLIVGVVREDRVQPVKLTIHPHWRMLVELMGADKSLIDSDASNYVTFPVITLTRLERRLWFNSQTCRFSVSPEFSQVMRLFGSLYDDPRLRWYWTKAGLSIVLDFCSSEPTTEPGRAARRRLEAAALQLQNSYRGSFLGLGSC